ncbi:MAG: PASTA domain-containing protein, partial [Clostridium sp.]|nr:PASTA domain-containing protein [Clostridium sp.]
VLTMIREEGVPLTYPVIIDMEDTWYDGSTPGRANGNTPAVRSQVAAAFCQVIASAGYKPMVYGSKSYLQGRFAGLGSYGVWVAHYADMPRTNYSGSYQMWQYTSKGSVAGISGNVDMNICYVDYKYGRDLNSIGTYATAQVPDLSGKTVEEARTALDRVTLNCTLTEQYSDTVEAGKVVSQSIAPGTQVDERTTVEVVISKGKEQKAMINVVGSSQAEAVSALEALGLRVIINTANSDTVPAGCVVSQSVSAGTTLYAGDSVTLVISAGPAGGASSEDGSSGSGGSEGTTVAPPASETGATGVSATVQ